MAARENDLVLELESIPRSAAISRHAVGRLAREVGADSDAARTVVTELVANAVRHAYPHDEPGPVVVLARFVRGLLIVTVSDRGQGMRPAWSGHGHGIGLPLVSELARDVRIESDDSGVAVSASFASRAASGPRGTKASDRSLERELRRAREMIARTAPRRTPPLSSRARVNRSHRPSRPGRRSRQRSPGSRGAGACTRRRACPSPPPPRA